MPKPTDPDAPKPCDHGSCSRDATRVLVGSLELTLGGQTVALGDAGVVRVDACDACDVVLEPVHLAAASTRVRWVRDQSPPPSKPRGKRETREVHMRARPAAGGA